MRQPHSFVVTGQASRNNPGTHCQNRHRHDEDEHRGRSELGYFTGERRAIFENVEVKTTHGTSPKFGPAGGRLSPATNGR